MRSSGTFEWTARRGPLVKYQCDPHAGTGMRGVLVVE
ncbi:plastocyanin/azurin family copper-binding protein [Halomarina halobia]|uniref:Plastocyanin/azurin family copper-binding protein n=1 Tax=Halomarina halobia TaxID=3033386 RepID=A0ABD6AAL5_9EURY